MQVIMVLAKILNRTKRLYMPVVDDVTASTLIVCLEA